MMIDSITSCTIFICNLGEIFGPIVAGVSTQFFGFAYGFSIMAGIIFMFLFIYFAVAFKEAPGKKIRSELECSLLAN